MEENKVDLMADYGKMCGQIYGVDGKPDGIPSPMEYLNEFIEGVWQPSREDCAEFLSNFYRPEKIAQWITTIAWEEDEVDDSTQVMRDVALDALGDVVYQFIGNYDVNIVDPVWDALNDRIKQGLVEHVGDFVVQFVEAIKEVKDRG